MEEVPMESTERRSATEQHQLSNDLVVEILSRLPIKSLCRFKCVSKSWLALFSHPDYCNKLRQTLAGLFCVTNPVLRPPHYNQKRALQFASLSTHHPPFDAALSFVPHPEEIAILHCCNGLLLCCRRYDCYVCNPATRQWLALPNHRDEWLGVLALAFDPRSSPHFHVLCFKQAQIEDGEGSEDEDVIEEAGYAVTSLEVFSSETGKWVKSQVDWRSRSAISLDGGRSGRVFVNGMVHLLDSNGRIVAVDPEGEECHLIGLPGCTLYGATGCIGQSQGFLHYAKPEQGNDPMEIWFLDRRWQWTLKHRVDLQSLRANHDLLYAYDGSFLCYMIVFHPECDLVFLPVKGKLLSYSLKSGDLHEACSLMPETDPIFFVYAPCYSECFNFNSDGLPN